MFAASNSSFMWEFVNSTLLNTTFMFGLSDGHGNKVSSEILGMLTLLRVEAPDHVPRALDVCCDDKLDLNEGLVIRSAGGLNDLREIKSV